METRFSLGDQLGWLVLGFGVPAFVLGVPYMIAPYERVEDVGVVWGWGPFVLFGVALVLTAVGRVPVRRAALAVAGALIAVVALRVVVDVAVDPTSHNLWPFEFVIAGVLGGGAAVLGAVLGWLWVRIWDRA